jgi:hypothetical protein
MKNKIIDTDKTLKIVFYSLSGDDSPNRITIKRTDNIVGFSVRSTTDIHGIIYKNKEKIGINIPKNAIISFDNRIYDKHTLKWKEYVIFGITIKAPKDATVLVILKPKYMLKYERLLKGQTLITSEHGNSMSPVINSGQKHKLEPVKWQDCNKGDIVYCKVKGHFYTHFVKTTDPVKGCLIGSNKGSVNGWTKRVYGKVTEILN